MWWRRTGLRWVAPKRPSSHWRAVRMNGQLQSDRKFGEADRYRCLLTHQLTTSILACDEELMVRLAYVKGSGGARTTSHRRESDKRLAPCSAKVLEQLWTGSSRNWESSKHLEKIFCIAARTHFNNGWVEAVSRTQMWYSTHFFQSYRRCFFVIFLSWKCCNNVSSRK